MTSSALTATAASGRVPSFGEAPMSLFLDVDGTLLDLVERPSDVTIPGELIDALARSERKLDGALALVSGRPIEELDRLFAPLRLRASGVHGAQVRLDPGAPPRESPGAMELPRSLWTALTQALSEFPGVFAENKRFSFAVHYRLAPESEPELRAAVMRVLEAHPDVRVEVMDAHSVVELKAPGWDKGRAIELFLAKPPFLGRTPIFVGDDTTDEAGFAVVSARGGFAYSVGKTRPGAIGAFACPKEVRDWLAAFSLGGPAA